MVPVAPRTRAIRESSEIEVINPVDKAHQQALLLQINEAELPAQKNYCKNQNESASEEYNYSGLYWKFMYLLRR